MYRVFLISVAIFCSSFANVANAKLFTINNRTGSCAVACDLLEDLVNKDLPDADQSTYLDGMANASVATQKGLGVDYASNMQIFLVGASGSIGADLGNNNMFDLLGGDVDGNQVRGFGAQVSANLGVNLGLFFKNKFWNRTNLYLNFLSVDVPDSDGLKGEVSNFGMHLQYMWLPGGSVGLGAFSYGGVYLTSGIEFSKLNISFREDFTSTVTEGSVTATFNGSATVGAEVTTTTIPIEISSNVRFLYLFTLFGGLGADFSFGEAKSIASVSGPISVTGSGGGTGTASLDLGQEGSPDVFAMRGFAGLQLNLTALRVSLQLTQGITNDNFAATLGASIAW